MTSSTQNMKILHIGIGIYLKPAILVLVTIFIIGSLILFWHIDQNEDFLVETMALENAKVQTELLNRFRSIYTTEVVEKALKHDLVATHDYAEKDNAIPLPATLTMQLGNQENEDGLEKIHSKLYSAYPFPWRTDTGGLQDDFAKEAWDTLAANPDDSFYRIETINNQKTLRYATTDRMQKSCVACHNNHPDTPRNNWKEGDVRGLLEVNIPLGTVTTQAAAAMQRTSIELLIVTVLGLIALVGILSRIHKQSKLTIKFADLTRSNNIELQKEVNERKEAEEKTNSLMARQEAVMKASVDPMATIDFDGIVQSISNSFEAILGWKREEIIGKNISVIIPEPHRSNHNSYLKKYKDTGKTNILYLTREFSAVRKDGTEFPCELTVSRVDVPEQDHTFFAGIIRDITQRKQIEEENIRLEDQLRQSQKMEAIGTLAGGIAHDFNNLLTAIKGFTELAIIDAPEQSNQRDSLDEVLTASNRAADLVQQILTFSRQSEEDKQIVDMNEITKDTLKLLRSLIPSTIDFQCHLPDSPISILSDSTKLHQIIVNLCTNAAGAMKHTTGKITLSLKSVVLTDDKASNLNLSPGTYCQLDVTDTGQGISPENIKRIFDPFFTTKDVGEGTGMGLAVVHAITKSHGGTITVDSEIDKGTTFSVYLPMSSQPITSEITPPTPSQNGHERILLVDDEEVVVRLNKKLLFSNGYDVVIAHDGSSALDIYKESPDDFSLIISDQAMPNMKGDELAASILELNPAARIIIASGYSETMDSAEARKQGIRHFLKKPVSSKKLLQTIRQVLDEE